MLGRRQYRVSDSIDCFFNKRLYPKTAHVSAFARSFVSQAPIQDAIVTIIENPTFKLRTDENGRCGPFVWPVGQPLTLRIEKPGSWLTGYRTTQTATIVVPDEGINHTEYVNHLSFQVPSLMAFTFLSWAMGRKEDKSTGQIAVTVTPKGKTMDDIPQGEEDVEVSISPNTGHTPIYLGIMWFTHKTNFFPKYCQGTKTTKDGGVLFVNVPEGTYTITAKKGEQVQTIIVKSTPNVLTNASPPFGLVMR